MQVRFCLIRCKLFFGFTLHLLLEPNWWSVYCNIYIDTRPSNLCCLQACRHYYFCCSRGKKLPLFTARVYWNRSSLHHRRCQSLLFLPRRNMPYRYLHHQRSLRVCFVNNSMVVTRLASVIAGILVCTAILLGNKWRLSSYREIAAPPTIIVSAWDKKGFRIFRTMRFLSVLIIFSCACCWTRHRFSVW